MAKDEKNKKNKNPKKSFLKESKAELKKVSWPTPKSLANDTATVIGIVLVVAIIVFILDFIFLAFNENVLIKEYKEQILQKYKEEVNSMASFTSDRKRYQQLVAILRRMNKIKGGIEIVDDIVKEWRIKYKNRPAMMDELSRL